MQSTETTISVVSLRSALADAGLVQSFSGVRTVFGHGPAISPDREVLVSAYGYCYARRVLCAGQSKSLLLGRDPRPTGEAVGRALVRGFLAGARACRSSVEVLDLGIITTPLAETAVRSLDADGGVMVTASHNPIEHNGFKFLTGCAESSGNGSAPPGALLSAVAMEAVIDDVAALAEGRGFSEFAEHLTAVDGAALEQALSVDHEAPRVKAERAYLDVIGRDWGITPHCLKPLTLGPALLDPNGGAGCGIGARVLEHFGVRVIEINAELGYPEHGIDTDGIDPASGRHMLMRVARATARERAHFGVAFDYDADRGNLVLPGHDESAIISPQRVATFNIALALARRRVNGAVNSKLAVVISDATSLASARVARAFGAEVFLVETGEINVVTKMDMLRREGWDVPVGVEGANGGTIFETATCRDGLQAALSAALAESQPEVSREWVRISANGKSAPDQLTLQELVASVPVNPNVLLRLSSPPMTHAEIKRRVEDVFARSVWPGLRSRFATYEFQNFEGSRQVEQRTGDESGAWRVMLRAQGREAFVFLRGSRTEAGVWRMIVDADDAADFAVLEPAARAMFDEASSE
jgi:phosphoglucomutase